MNLIGEFGACEERGEEVWKRSSISLKCWKLRLPGRLGSNKASTLFFNSTLSILKTFYKNRIRGETSFFNPFYSCTQQKWVSETSLQFCRYKQPFFRSFCHKKRWWTIYVTILWWLSKLLLHCFSSFLDVSFLLSFCLFVFFVHLLFVYIVCLTTLFYVIN